MPRRSAARSPPDAASVCPTAPGWPLTVARVHGFAMGGGTCLAASCDFRVAARDGDAHTLEHTAHTLKGSASSFGAERVRQAAYALEQAGRDGDLDSIERLLDALEAELNPMGEALRAIRQEAAL